MFLNLTLQTEIKQLPTNLVELQYKVVQVAQLSQRDCAAGWVSFVRK